jgi:PAS domain S-box-containing protein
MEVQLNQIRSKLINTLMKGFIYFLIPALLFSLSRYFQIGWQSIYLFHITLVVISCFVYLFRSKLSIGFKAHFLSIIFLLLAFAGAIRFGVSSSYYFCIFSVIVSTLFFGKRTAIYYILISIIGLVLSIIIHRYTHFNTLTDFNSYNNNITTRINLISAIIFIMVILFYLLGSFYEFFIYNITDLEAKTKAQEVIQNALQKSNERYRLLIDNVAFPIIVTTFESEILFFNQCCENFCGLSLNNSKDILIKDLWINNEDQIAYINDLKLYGFIKNKEIQIYSKNKNIKTVLISSNIIEFDGQVAVFNVYNDITELKKAEALVREKDIKIRSAFDLSFVFIGLLNVDGTLIEANQTAMSFIGLKPEDVIGKPFWETPWWNHSTESQQKLKEAIATVSKGDVVTYEAPHFAKDGTLHTIDFSLRPIKNEAEEVILLMAEGRDITEQKNAEIILRESEMHLRTLIDTIPDLIWLKDKNGVYLQCNNRFEDLYGAKEKEIIGKTDYDFSDVESANIYRKNDILAMNAGKSTIIEEPVVFADGHKEIVESIKTPLMGSNGELIGVLGIGRNITERIKAQQELAESQLKLSAVFESTNDLIWTVDSENFKIESFNQAFSSFFLKQGVQVKKGSTIDELLPPERAQRWYDIYKDVLIKGTREVQLEVATGRQVFNYSFYPLKLNNKIIGISSFGKDITESKELEKQIINSVIETEEHERLHFSQELHDGIGPLLSAIKMYIQWLETPEAKENQNEILKDIEQLVEESSSTIREISFKLSPHILQNYGLVEAVKTYIEKIKESSQIELQFDCNDMYRLSEKAETIIYRVLCECINNTLKHAFATKILIKMNITNDILNFEYEDNGKGFNANEVLEKRSGIGLLNMQSRIKSINGIFDLQSLPQKGTKIKIQLNTNVIKKQ